MKKNFALRNLIDFREARLHNRNSRSDSLPGAGAMLVEYMTALMADTTAPRSCKRTLLIAGVNCCHYLLKNPEGVEMKYDMLQTQIWKDLSELQDAGWLVDLEYRRSSDELSFLLCLGRDA